MKRTTRVSAWVAAFASAALAIAISSPTSAVGASRSGSADRTGGSVAQSIKAGPTLSSHQLRHVLAKQDLPTTELIPTTATSHPWNGAAWQNVPIDLAK